MRNSGPAAARNYGARGAKATCLLASTLTSSSAGGGASCSTGIRRMLGHGRCTSAPTTPSPPRCRCSLADRDLLHHFVADQGSPEASTFWAGCGAVDAQHSRQWAASTSSASHGPRLKISSWDIGSAKLAIASFWIKLFRARTSKRWTLRAVIWTDVVRRAISWSRFLLANQNTPDDLNLTRGQRLSVALLGLAGALLPLVAWRIELLSLPAVALVGVIALNRRLYAFFARQRGLGFAAVCLPLHLLYYLCCGLRYAWIEVHHGDAA